MRIAVVAASLLAALTAAGCGSGTTVELVWGGPPKPGPQGVVSTDGFASFQKGVDEAWERSAAMAAAEFLRLDERKARRVSIVGTAGAEGGGPQTVVVTLDGVPDDSIRSERWTLGFDEKDGVYTLSSAIWEQRCRPGRGHDAFSPEPCV